VVKVLKDNNRIHNGVCSYHLSQLNPGDKTPIFVRKSTFRLPKDPKTPIVLVGAGSGVAPLMGFIQEREFQRSQGISTGRELLFFGSYHRNTDFLYGDYLESLKYLELHTAFSHDQVQISSSIT
jgi:sulfite reductase alpha subunit-like flavoprotein